VPRHPGVPCREIRGQQVIKRQKPKSKIRLFGVDGVLDIYKNGYPILSAKAMRVLIPFATSYLCEAGFSAVVVIKTKYRSKINVETKIGVAVSSFIPRFEQLCSEQQAHLSY